MTKYSRILSYPATRVNEFKTTPTQPLYLYNEQHRELPTILTQFPIVLLRVKNSTVLATIFSEDRFQSCSNYLQSIFWK